MAKINDHKGSDWGGSVISRFQTCKRKHYLAEEAPHPNGGRGLELIDAKQGTASEFGVIVHYGLQLAYLNKIMDMKLLYTPDGLPGEELITVDNPMTYAEMAVQAMQFAVNMIKDEWPGKDLFKDEVIACLDQYFTKYEVDDIKPLKAEHPISIKIGDFIHTGIIDLEAEWLGEACIIDHKTTSLQWDKFFKKWFDVLSLKGYVYAKWKESGEIVPILINGIRRRGDKALTCEFRREVIHYSKADLEEFERTVLFERGQIDFCREQNFWPKSGDRCIEVWGECEFIRICRFPSDAMVKTFYKPRERK